MSSTKEKKPIQAKPRVNKYLDTFTIDYEGHDPEKVMRGMQRRFMQTVIDMANEGAIDRPDLKGLTLRPREEVYPHLFPAE